jgi:hypothetical protein
VYIVVYVDDFKIYIFIREIIDVAKEKIMTLFFMKDFESIIYYLELYVERDRQARNIYFT